MDFFFLYIKKINSQGTIVEMIITTHVYLI